MCGRRCPGRAGPWVSEEERAKLLLARLWQVAPTRPHPKVNGELANKLAAPLFGPADRLRDLASRLTAARKPG